MKLKDFDFSLPEDLIAQYPPGERDASRLMVLRRETGEVLHRTFSDIKDCLREGDLLVLNDTKVMPARLFGKKATGGRIEVLLVEKVTGDKEVWKCLINSSKVKGGTVVLFDEGVSAGILGRGADGLWECEFKGDISGKLDRLGKIPLPPYIKREAEDLDRERYQTVFAGVKGAVAAPTAGLHFTGPLLEEIRKKGVEVRHVTLHTGPGTFMPVRVDDIKDHRMHKERYAISPEVFNAVLKAKRENRRVVGVGTTSARALEAAVLSGFESPVLSGHTDIFIYPGFEFKVMDALLTNFHLPGSTLIMLVSAFAGLDNLLNAYREAVREGYRFFSYGDAMLII
ncbi:MAG: tRNA preQ1(34) S-adenosylmethionine ribosyltransferase-isomerase QueA [Deltaproteobacteria bacterium]|nr:tRNA preQ1(34) S-adenosylmethionine ribosyltransferase-isomerase QueA [Deltaproteobacteria bacterium]